MLKDYYKKHVAQRPLKDKEARSGGNKHTNTAKFNDTVQEVNTMKYNDEPTPKKEEGNKKE